MTKEEKMAENSTVLKAWEDCKINTEAAKDSALTFKLRNCQAVVIEVGNYYLLKSYETIVAFIDRYSGICYDILRYVYGYTATSAQHIAKFANDYHAYSRMTYRD